MRKLFIVLFTAALSCVSLHAQDVYKSIRDKAQQTVQAPGTTGVLKEFNQFKVDALDYLLIKMREQMPDSSTVLLDKEAYALNNFINLYTATILEVRTQPKADMIEVVKIFMDASYSNPLFNDADKELALAYFSDGKSMTRFSLDTDWRRAYIAASVEIKRWKENKAKTTILPATPSTQK